MNNRTIPLILCIEDDADTLSLLHYLLKHGNYDVMTAGEGRRGIQLATDNQPDVILLDIEMPGLNGYEVCLQLQKNPLTAYIPVVFLTAHKTDQDKKKAFAAGAADFLSKPFYLNPLLNKIRLQLERNVKWQQLKEPSSAPAPPSLSFLDFKKITARKLCFSPDRYARWLQISSLQIYDKAGDFGLAHNELAQLIAEFVHAPYIQHMRSHIIRIGVMPSAFSKANNIVAVDAAECGLNFILSNPFNLSVLDAMKKCMGADTTARFAVTEPANIGGLFERSLREKISYAKQSWLPVCETRAHSALSLVRPDDISPEDKGNQGIAIPDAVTTAVEIEEPPTAPVAEIAVKAAPAPDAAGASCSTKPAILLVDDDAGALLLEQHFLAAEGYQVTLASDGIDALLALEEHHFDLIVSDINMPNLDGYKLLEMLGQQGSPVPVILVTGSTGPEDEIKGLVLGAEDYMRKPINKEVLLFRVRKALGEHRRHLGAA